jgi:hypothetical protein
VGANVTNNELGLPTASVRVGRGFHRLGAFLAGIILLLGVGVAAFDGYMKASGASLKHNKLVCARDKIRAASDGILAYDRMNTPKSGGVSLDDPLQEQGEVTGQISKKHVDLPPGLVPDDMQDLQKLGCVTWPEQVSAKAALAEGDSFSWTQAFLSSDAPIILAVTLGLSLAAYLLMRVIGWVAAGFASS